MATTPVQTPQFAQVRTGSDRRVLVTEGPSESYTTASRGGCGLAVPPSLELEGSGTMTRAEYLAWMGR